MGNLSQRNHRALERGFSFQKSSFQTYRKVRVAGTHHGDILAEEGWRDFLEGNGYSTTEIDATLSEGNTLPSVDIVKLYLHWHVSQSRGMSTELTTQNTMLKVLNWILSLLQQKTGKEYSKHEREDMKCWMRMELFSMCGVKNVVRAKYNVYTDDIRNLAWQLWVEDTDEFASERQRAQTAWVTLFMANSAARPQATLSDKVYPDLFLKYRDFTLYLYRSETTGEPRFGLSVRLRFMKGEKLTNQELQIVLLESQEFLQCPITLFLSFALADEAFKDIRSPEMLLSLPAPATSEPVPLPWKDSMLDMPVLRKSRKYQKAGYRQQLSTHDYRYHLADLSVRAGYSVPILPYDIRRGAANEMDERHDISVAQQQQMLGQKKRDVYQRFYQSEVSAVNLQRTAPSTKKDFDRLVKNLRRIPKHADDKIASANKVREVCDTSLSPDSVERLGDLRLHETKVELFYLLNPHRRTVREAVRKEVAEIEAQAADPEASYEFNLRKALPLVKALTALAQNFLEAMPLAKKIMSTRKGCMRCDIPHSVRGNIKHHMLHFRLLDKFCGSISIHATVVVPPRCLFCLQTGLIYEENRKKHFKEHILHHLQSICLPLCCPHPRCLPKIHYKDQDSFFNHVLHEHSLDLDEICTTEKQMPQSRKRMREVAQLRQQRYEDRTKV